MLLAVIWKLLRDSEQEFPEAVVLILAWLLIVTLYVWRAEYSLPTEHSAILLPADHRIVDLFVRWMHERRGLAGVDSTLLYLRDTHWIIRGRQRIKAVISECVDCQLINSWWRSCGSSDWKDNKVIPIWASWYWLCWSILLQAVRRKEVDKMLHVRSQVRAMHRQAEEHC